MICFSADIVICDLSGVDANPNVMYELGVRLSISSRPVILIREKNVSNAQIFAVGGFYTFDYNPHRYAELEMHLVNKIRRLETGVERYQSPVLKVLATAPQVVQLIASQQMQSQLTALDTGLYALLTMVVPAVFAFAKEQGEDLADGEDPPAGFDEPISMILKQRYRLLPLARAAYPISSVGPFCKYIQYYAIRILQVVLCGRQYLDASYLQNHARLHQCDTRDAQRD